MRFYIVRHGESVGNLNKICLGHTDLGLTDRGREQAELTALALEKVNFYRIYSSDLCRAVETALPNATVRGIDESAINRRSDLRELYFGDWENAAVEELKNNYGDMFTVGWRQNFGTFTPPNGESVPDLADRICSALSEIARECILDIQLQSKSRNNIDKAASFSVVAQNAAAQAENSFKAANVDIKAENAATQAVNVATEAANAATEAANGATEAKKAAVKAENSFKAANVASEAENAVATDENAEEKADNVAVDVTNNAPDNGEINVLVVTHAASIRAFWGKISGYRAEEVCAAVQFPSNASYSVVDFDTECGAFTPISYSVDGHLSDLKTALPG